MRRVGEKEGAYPYSAYAKSQISTFLIIALVLVLFVAVTFVIVNTQLSLRDKANQAIVSDLALFPPEQFVTHCVQREVVDVASLVLAQGGVWDIASPNVSGRNIAATSFRSQPYVFWSRGSNNELISDDFVAAQMNQQLPGLLNTCLNLSLYENAGYDIQAGTIRTNTTIQRDTVHVTVYFPLTLHKGSTSIERTIFSVDVDLPIGRMLEYGRLITNSHLSNSLPLDSQQLMHRKENIWQGKPLITIDTNTVYPHTLYVIELAYKGAVIPLRFAIEGTDVFSSGAYATAGPGQGSGSENPAVELSSCVTSGACFSSVPYDVCVQNGGEYTAGRACPAESAGDLNTPVNSGNADPIGRGRAGDQDPRAHGVPVASDAVATFSTCVLANGSVMRSGSSWCSASTDGTPLVGVGSRASRLLCVNGKIQQDPCQDLRTQVCAQDSGDADHLPAAQCRPNTALSCSACTDQSCCVARDCVFTTANVCVPKVPQGIPFWRADISVCQQQFSAGVAAAAHSGKSLATSAQAQLCAQYADCGATVSVLGERTVQETSFTQGYYQKLVSFWQQQKPAFISRVPVSSAITSSGAQPALSTLLSSALADIEQLAAYDAKDYLDPTVAIPLQGETSICQSYNSPSADAGSGRGSSCSYCASFGRACSEYVCRSLGASCRALPNASTDSGVMCVDSRQLGIATTPLSITSATEIDPVGIAHPLLQTKINSLVGFAGPSQLSPRELLTINFTTDRPALCKPTYLPSLLFANVGSLDLSNGAYSTQHQLRLRFVNDLPVFDRMLAHFAVPDYEQLVSALADFKLRLDQLRLKYSFIGKYSPTFYPYLSAVVDQYLSERTRPTLLALLDGISSKKFAIFLVCQDEYGNELGPDSRSFISVQLASACQPVPPQVVHVVPDADPYVSSRFTLYLDKVGTCRFDPESLSYDAMRYNMTCASSEYDLASDFDGTYACVAALPASLRNASQVYYSCSDDISGQVVARNITLVHDSTQRASVFLNMSANQTDTLPISNNATIMTGAGYRCGLDDKDAQTRSSSSSSMVASSFSASCTIGSCTVKYIDVVSGLQSVTFACAPRLPATSCPQTQVHAGAPVALTLDRLPSLTYEDVSVRGNLFVVSVRARGPAMTCSASAEDGQTYAFTQRDNQTFTLPSSVLPANSLVKIICRDKYGSGPQYVAMVKK